jgi:hypothetical protein
LEHIDYVTTERIAVALIVVGPTWGRSPLLERTTHFLTRYVFTNPVGAFAFVLGLLGGRVAERRRPRGQ